MTKRFEVSSKSLNKILNYLHSEENEREMVSFLLDLTLELRKALDSDLKIPDNQYEFQNTLARIAIGSYDLCEFFGDIANLSDAKVFEDNDDI